MKVSLGAKTLAQPTPVWVIGSYDAEGKPNVMTAAWGGICCSQPPCVAVSLREERYSYPGIVQHHAFTVSIPSKAYAAQADYFGIVSGKDVDKFKVTGLTPVGSTVVDAPYVAEFPLVLECVLVQTITLGIHIQLVGEILDVKADKDVLDDKGYPDAAKVQPLIFTPINKSYHSIGDQVGMAFSMGLTFRNGAGKKQP